MTKNVKGLVTSAIIIASAAYYACIPFVVANAGGNPGVNSPINLQMRVTAYASVPNETDSTPFIMADGQHVRDGAAASNILPFGTKIQIPSLFGNKVFTIEDRMSPRIKNTIDLWMPSVRQAIIFGSNHADIVILEIPTSTVNLAAAR